MHVELKISFEAALFQNFSHNVIPICTGNWVKVALAVEVKVAQAARR
jgi:hypothetical protein